MREFLQCADHLPHLRKLKVYILPHELSALLKLIPEVERRGIGKLNVLVGVRSDQLLAMRRELKWLNLKVTTTDTTLDR